MADAKKAPVHPLAATAGDTNALSPDPAPTPEEVAAQEKAVADEKAIADAQARDNKPTDEERAAAAAAAEEADGAEKNDSEPSEPATPGWYATDDAERPAHMIFLLDQKGQWHSVTSGLHTEPVQWWYVATGGAVKLLVPLLSPAAQEAAAQAEADAAKASTDWA